MGDDNKKYGEDTRKKNLRMSTFPIKEKKKFPPTLSKRKKKKKKNAAADQMRMSALFRDGCLFFSQCVSWPQDNRHQRHVVS